MKKANKIVVSGMRPTGRLHLGHFHGVLENWLELQKLHTCYFFVADWHALTTEYQTPDNLFNFSQEMVLDWLALGLDPNQATLFIQSHIPEHAELHLLLAMLTPISWLERVPSYKELKMELKDKDLSTYGFLGYPLLQTADVAIYKADYVPVGQDQVAHLELAREVIRRFNFLYGQGVLKECQPLLTKTQKLLGLDNRKMSKSYDNCIYLSDDAVTLQKKMSVAITDPARVRRTDPGNPDVCNVFAYHKIYSPAQEVAEVDKECRRAGIGCMDCKKKVSHNIIKFLEPTWQKRAELQKDKHFVMDILEKGAKQARSHAQATLHEVNKVMKLG